MKSIALVLSGFLVLAAHAAPPVVSNFRASQVPGTQYEDIYYDLSDPDGGTMTIEVRVSSDGGLTYSVPVATLGGAHGSGVTLGTGKLVRWYAGTDFGGNFIERCKVRITATDGNLPSAPAGMMTIPAGYFQMGDTLEGAGSPTANILITQFSIDRTEISKGKWDEVRVWAAGPNGFTDLAAGSSFNGALHPVHRISWYDAVKWCNARSIKENLVPCYYTNMAKTEAHIYKTGSTNLTADMVLWNANGYRLPTEAEWEKAARDGVTGRRFPWGTDTITHSQANYYSSSSYAYDISPTRNYHPIYGRGTAPCGSFPANGYGLYDMAGNLLEWTWDFQGGTLGTPSATNPVGPVSGTRRVLRGGCWYDYAFNCRTAYREGNDSTGGVAGPGYAKSGIGFRTVRR